MDVPPDGWLDISLWSDCRRMERPGYIFEVQNADGMAVFTPCVPTIEFPYDWSSPALRFRLIPVPVPTHSDPIPPPAAER